MKQSVAVMDLGTSKITVLIVSRGANNSIVIDGIGVCKYGGFAGGQWLDPNGLQSAIVKTIALAEERARTRIEKLYVGVPNDFSKTCVADVSISLNKKCRVTDRDVEILKDSGNKYKSDLDWTLINIQPIYYTLDDERKLVDPVGLTSTRLGGSISYIMAFSRFMMDVSSAVNAANVPQTEFLSGSFAELMYLFDDYTRDRCVMLADVGDKGTSFTLGRGDGIAVQHFFAWGGARITKRIADSLGISFEEAELLKRKVILSLDPDFDPPEGTDIPYLMREYTVEVRNELHTYPVGQTNAAVRAEIERFAGLIKRTLKDYCDYEYPRATPLSITGGGLGNIRGGAEYLAEVLERDVNIVKPDIPGLDKPQFSSPLALASVVLTFDAPVPSFFGRVKHKLFKR